jgi:hypothetical protein
VRKSRAITLTVLSGLTLTACCVTAPGCGRRPAPTSHTWYDASGNPVAEKWKTDEHGNRALDPEGRPIPDPHVPCDQYGRPWVYADGAWVPLPQPVGSSYSRSGPWLFWGGTGYRSVGGSYHPGVGTSSSPARSSSPASISRGGFGSTGTGGGG